MSALGGDPTVGEEHHPVGEADGGEAVRHNEGGGRQRLAQVRQHAGLHHRVDGTGGVVKDQHAGLAGQGACERQTLALAARKTHPALAHRRVPTLGRGENELVGVGDAGDLGEFLTTQLAGEVHVGAQRVGEKERLLEHQCHGLTQRGRIEFGDVDPPDLHRPRGGIHESHCEFAQGRLARPGGPHECHHLTGGHAEREVVEHPGPVRPGEPDVIEPQRHRARRDRRTDPGLRSRGDRQDPVDAPRGHHRPGQFLQEEPDDADGEGQQAEQRRGGDQSAGVHGARTDTHRTDESDDDDPEARERVDGRFEHGPHPTHRHPGVTQVVGRNAHAFGFRIGDSQGLDRQRAVETFVGHPGHLGQTDLHPGHQRRDPVGVGTVQQCKRRKQHQGHQRDPRVHDEQRHQ